jgi:hypothetical protein
VVEGAYALGENPNESKVFVLERAGSSGFGATSISLVLTQPAMKSVLHRLRLAGLLIFLAVCFVFNLVPEDEQERQSRVIRSLVK